MDVETGALLVYGWLREHGLHKTCTALAEEYGPSLASHTPPSITLNDILQRLSNLLQLFTNSSLSRLLTTLKPEPPDSTVIDKPGKSKAAAKKPRKRKASVSQDAKTSPKGENKSVDTTTDLAAGVQDVGASNSRTSNAAESAPELSEKNNDPTTAPVKKGKKAPKEKKLPLFPEGVWVCPEMEDTLSKVFERTMLSIDVNKDIPLIPEIVAVLSDSKDGDVTPDSTVVPAAANEDGAMFTEDSDSDSDDESSKPSTKNSNLVPPSTPIKTVQAEITKSTPSSPSLLEVDLTTTENTEKKKKNKKKNFAAHLEHIGNPITPLEIVGNDETSYIVKKKKKKHLEETTVLSEFTPLVPLTDSSTSETESKKKKKKVKDEVLFVPPMEPIVEEAVASSTDPETEEVKKKKKKRKKSIGGNSDNVVLGPTESIVENGPATLETKIIPQVSEAMVASETPSLKKKKKKTPSEQNLISTPSPLVTTTPSKENAPMDDQLALSSLGQSLKKKKKKSKNIGQ